MAEEQSGWKAKNSVRKHSPQVNESIAEQLLAATQEAIFHEAEPIPNGSIVPLELRPKVQQSGETCLLASVEAIKDAITRRKDRVPFFNESVAAEAARLLGLLGRGGMATENPLLLAQTQTFLREQYGITLDFINSNDPTVLGRSTVQALRDSRVPIINSSLGGSIGHWVSIYGMDKQGPRSIGWRIADPLRIEPYPISTPQLAEKLLGRGGIATQMFRVDVKEFRASAFRAGSPR